MNVLVDTHAVIWSITDNNRLVDPPRKIIENSANNCIVSIASLWEMGIKVSIGKLKLKNNLKHTFQIIEETGFTILPINSEHIAVNAQLKFHHRDPFDRIIIAQAIHEELTIISKDRHFKEYDVELIW